MGGKKTLYGLLLAALVFGGCSYQHPRDPGTPATPSAAHPPNPLQLPPQAHESARYAQDMLQSVNAVRSRGYACASGYYPPAPPVRWDARLAASAQAHANDLAAQGRLSHYGSSGSTPFERMRAAGYQFANAGENVGQGHPDVATVVERWLLSRSGHCEALMDAAYRDMGAGLAHGQVDGRITRFWVFNAGWERR